MKRGLLLFFCTIFLVISSGFSTIHPDSRAVFPTPAAQLPFGYPIPVIYPRPNLRFDCLTTADGLSYNLGIAIIQDRQGFMWFGTRAGINKYDGYSFTISVMDPGDDFLTDVAVRDMLQDHLGNLWIVTRNDLVRRDGSTGGFVHYKRDASNPGSLREGMIATVAEDSSGNLWVGTIGGIYRFDPVADTFTRFLPKLAITSILFDHQGGMWLGTYSGLYYSSSSSLENPSLIHYYHSYRDPASLGSDWISSVYEDSRGAIWVGTLDAGLDRLDRKTGKFTHYRPNPGDPYSLSDDRINSIMEDSAGRLWIGTYNGLNLFDQATGRFHGYYYDPDDSQSLISNQVLDIYQDRAGILWFATFGGICKINDLASLFTQYQQAPNHTDTLAGKIQLPGLSDNQVSAIYQDHQGFLWIGTYSGNLNRLDRGTGVVTVYRDDLSGFNDMEVTDIVEDHTGTFWIGTDYGLIRFYPRTGAFQVEAAFQGAFISSIVEDPHGALWVFSSLGIMRRAAGTSTFKRVPSTETLSKTGVIGKMFQDRSGDFWISTQKDGLFRLDMPEQAGAEPSLIHYPQDTNNPQSPGVGVILTFYEDENGTLWLGGIEDGLIRYDRDTRTFTRYMPDDSTPAVIGCIQGDSQGFLWFGTRLGLARFDPHTETFQYFDKRDGLMFGQAMSCYKNGQGEMFFGSWSGLVTFFPETIHDNLNPPAVVITSMNVNNQLLRTDLPSFEQIDLSYRENYLSFDFAALDYAAPAKNQYAYKMEGLDSDWIQAGVRRHAEYPDLKPGTYTFRVKASNSSGIWNQQGAEVQITIRPPFWQSWWFIGLLGLSLAVVIVGGVRLRFKGLEARSHALEKLVHERTGALEQKTLELQQLYERSHDLAVIEERNRLARELHDAVTQTLFSASLVAEALPATWEKDPQEGRGLLQELRSLSRGALAEMRTLLLELRPAALADTRLEDLLRQLGEAASGRGGISVVVQVEGQAGSLPSDVQIAFYRITQEALNNVVKHARAHQVIIQLNYIDDDQMTDSQSIRQAGILRPGMGIMLSIRDDGRGFDPAEIPHNRLGLGIMQERAQGIGALLTVDSKPGHGTQVTVRWKPVEEEEAK